MALKGLVIRRPWIGLILEGRKTWEMRSQPCRHRGPVALIEKGTGMVVGLARLVEDLPAQSPEQLRANHTRHCIPQAEIAQVIEKGWVRPWVLGDVQRLERPVAYEHTSGGSWVNLSSEEERAVLAAARAPLTSRAVVSSRLGRAPGARPATSEELRLAENLAGTRIDGSVTNSSVRQVGSKLYIDVEWDEPQPVRRGGSIDFQAIRMTIGSLLFLISVVWLTYSAIALLFGMLSESYSALKAFLWALPACILLGISVGILDLDGR